MGTTNDYFQRLIHQAMAKRIGSTIEMSDQLWRLLSRQLIAIIGEGGFNALLARSISIMQSQFGWLADCDVRRSSESQLADLKTSLEKYGGDQAGDISKLLLMTLVTNLAELIGHQLTIGILSASWNLEEQDLKDEELGDDR